MSLLNIGKYIIRLDTVDSTNNYAAALFVKDKPAEGTVIMADYQDAGRGQRTTKWESERAKNLLVSFIFYPQIDVADYFFINQCVSLAVHEVVENELVNNVKIKWPNDIMVNDRKVAGILIENSIRGNDFMYSLAGIGMNVNQIVFNRYSTEATSFALEQKKNFIVPDLLNKLCGSLKTWYQALNNEEHDRIALAYSKRLFRKDEWCEYEIADEKIKGAIRGVSEDGKLIIEKENGEKVKFNLKEVKFAF